MNMVAPYYVDEMNLSRTAEAVFYYLLDNGQRPLTIKDITDDCGFISGYQTLGFIRQLKNNGLLEIEKCCDGTYYDAHIPWHFRSTG